MTPDEALESGFKAAGGGALMLIGWWLRYYIPTLFRQRERPEEIEAAPSPPRRERRASPSDAVALRRIESEDDANNRLFEMLEERLTAVEKRCADCERREKEFGLRESRLFERIIRGEAYIDRLCEVLRSRDIPVPPRPIMTFDDLGDSGC